LAADRVSSTQRAIHLSLSLPTLTGGTHPSHTDSRSIH
jgi:hypothetical protein